MSKLSKKIGSIACIAVLALSSTTLISAAGNITDETFTFGFTGIGNKEQYTSARNKDDYSSMYMKVEYMDIDNFKARPFGWDGNRHYNSKAPAQTIGQEGVYYLKNYVKEDGYHKGGIHAYRAYWANGSASGVWSPDSI